MPGMDNRPPDGAKSATPGERRRPDMPKSPASKRQPPVPDLAFNLKRLRQMRGWTSSKLAAEAGLPQSTMSKVESGQMSLHFEKLWQLATVLDVDIAALFALPTDEPVEEPVTARRTIDRASKDYGIDEHYRFQYFSVELKNRLMIPLLLEVGRLEPVHEKGGGEIPMIRVVGERFAYVLEGPVEFHCAHYETVILQQGDSLYVDAAMPHAFVSPKGVTARVLTVLTSTDNEYLALCREAALRNRGDASVRHRQRESARRKGR